jgi:hypothetical protein
MIREALVHAGILKPEVVEGMYDPEPPAEHEQAGPHTESEQDQEGE